jgi:hypothetical protein
MAIARDLRGQVVVGSRFEIAAIGLNSGATIPIMGSAMLFCDSRELRYHRRSGGTQGTV